MKKLINILVAFLCSGAVLHAQALQNGKRDFLNEQYTAAEGKFREALSADPGNPEAINLLTRTLILENKTNEAQQVVNNAPSTAAGDPHYEVAKAAVMLNTGNATGARAIFDQLLEHTKYKEPDLVQLVAEVVIESPKGDLSYATTILENGIKKTKRDVILNILMGKAYQKQHNGSEAYKAFSKAIEKDASAAQAYYQMGLIFMSQKNDEMIVSYLNKALNADPGYAPAAYALYRHFQVSNPPLAKNYFLQYAAQVQPDAEQEYSYTDLLYLNKQYDSAILKAGALVRNEGEKVKPRMYKLIGYSYLAQGDSSKALQYMEQYFQHEADSNLVVKDYETAGQLYASVPGKEEEAVNSLAKAAAMTTNKDQQIAYYKQLAALSAKAEDFQKQAYWMGQVYNNDASSTNLTLFNWGLAAYKAKDFSQADSVFGLYTTKYPDQGFGYYWRARSNAAIDTLMEGGLAIPYYQKLETMLDKDTLTGLDKKWLKEAYGYLATYEANKEKDYGSAIAYFEKLLRIDPENENVKKYIKILEANIEIKNKSNAEAN